MCGGGGSPEIDTTLQDFTIKQAKRAREEAVARDKRVEYGMEHIKSIFEGGKTPIIADVRGKTYQKDKKYVLPNGKTWEPKKQTFSTVKTPIYKTVPGTGSTGGGYYDNDGDWRENTGVHARPAQRILTGYKKTKQPVNKSKQEQFEEVMGKLLVQTGVSKNEGIEPLLYDRKTAMRQFHMPQLKESYANAGDELTFALSRAGLGTSTAAIKKRADLDAGFDKEKAGVLSQIDADMASTRARYGDMRRSLEAGLRASGDAGTSIESALAARGDFALEQPTLNPITSQLNSFAQNIGAARQGYEIGAIDRIAGGGTSGTVNRDAGKVIR